MASETKRLDLADELAFAIGAYLPLMKGEPEVGGVYSHAVQQLHRAFERYLAARPADAKWPEAV